MVYLKGCNLALRLSSEKTGLNTNGAVPDLTPQVPSNNLRRDQSQNYNVNSESLSNTNGVGDTNCNNNNILPCRLRNRHQLQRERKLSKENNAHKTEKQRDIEKAQKHNSQKTVHSGGKSRPRPIPHSGKYRSIMTMSTSSSISDEQKNSLLQSNLGDLHLLHSRKSRGLESSMKSHGRPRSSSDATYDAKKSRSVGQWVDEDCANPLLGSSRVLQACPQKSKLHSISSSGSDIDWDSLTRPTRQQQGKPWSKSGRSDMLKSFTPNTISKVLRGITTSEEIV